MKIQLVDRRSHMIQEWRKLFGGCDNVEVIQSDIFECPTDCIVSPSNSFGFMDGGLDFAISGIGVNLQKRIQEKIRSEFHGELLVGQALLIETKNNSIPYVISAPTMRVPMILKDSVNVYLATRAVFILLKKQTEFPINKVSISAMGTGVGQMPIEYCALQMKKAYDDVFNENSFPKSWSDAQIDHQLLYSKESSDLQYV